MRGVLYTLLIVLFLEACAAPCAARPAYALDDGVYSVDAKVVKAGSDDLSVADAAFEKPVTLVAEDGKSYLDVRIEPVTASGLTGYLGFLAFYPTQHGTTLPDSAEPVAIVPQSYYDVDDGFNAEGGTDAAMRGMKYPESAVFEVDSAYSEVWIQVYVPLVEGLVSGGGTQRARLVLDCDSAQKVTDQEAAASAESAVEAYERAQSSGLQLLYDRIYQASMQLLQTNTYTAGSLENLRAARDAAQEVCAAGAADGRAVMKAMIGLVEAQQQLQKVPAAKAGGSKSDTSAPKKASKAKKGANSTAGKLDFAKLPDGTYTVYGEMIKTDQKSLSVSNNAIDHNVRIQVKQGRYTVLLTFKSMKLSGKTGALGKLWYFRSGYERGANGVPQGAVTRAKALSYLPLGNGKSYPRKVSFPLISEARDSGWVPLRVYVPIIESISKGAGAQEVYLKLDTGTVASGSKNLSGRSRTGASATQGAASSSSAAGSGDDGSLSALLGTAGDGGSGTSDGSSDGTSASPGDEGSDPSAASGSSESPSSDSTAAQEPPLKRYIGLIVGVPALIVCLYCFYVLFTRRDQIRGLSVRGSRS